MKTIFLLALHAAGLLSPATPARPEAAYVAPAAFNDVAITAQPTPSPDTIVNSWTSRAVIGDSAKAH